MFFVERKGSDFSLRSNENLRRTYLVANEEYKNEQLTRALFAYLGFGLPEKFLLVRAQPEAFSWIPLRGGVHEREAEAA